MQVRFEIFFYQLILQKHILYFLPLYSVVKRKLRLTQIFYAYRCCPVKHCNRLISRFSSNIYFLARSFCSICVFKWFPFEYSWELKYFSYTPCAPFGDFWLWAYGFFVAKITFCRHVWGHPILDISWTLSLKREKWLDRKQCISEFVHWIPRS